jgi:hypothetical protein
LDFHSAVKSLWEIDFNRHSRVRIWYVCHKVLSGY